MSENEPGLHRVLAELAEQERRRLGDSVSIDELVAYRRGELSESDAERVRDLLTADPEWAEIYLDLGRAEELEAAAGDVSEEEVGREWRSFERRLAPRGRLLPFRRLIATYPLSAVAASFLLAVVGTGFLMRPWLLPTASGEGVFAQLEPDGERGVLRGGNEVLAPSEEAEWIILELLPPTSAASGRQYPTRCRFEVWRGERKVLTRHALLQEQGSYVLTLPASLLTGSSFELRLFDPQHPNAGAFATYTVQVESTP